MVRLLNMTSTCNEVCLLCCQDLCTPSILAYRAVYEHTEQEMTTELCKEQWKNKEGGFFYRAVLLDITLGGGAGESDWPPQRRKVR